MDGLRCGRALRLTAWAAFAAGRLAQQKPSKRGRFERAQPSKASEHVKISLQLVARLHNLAKHRGRFYILYRFVAMESMRVQSCRGRKPVSILFSHTFLIHFSYHSHTGDTHGHASCFWSSKLHDQCNVLEHWIFLENLDFQYRMFILLS